MSSLNGKCVQPRALVLHIFEKWLLQFCVTFLMLVRCLICCISVYYVFMVDLKVVMASMPLSVLWHVVRGCWCMGRALSSVPCPVTITAWNERCDGGHQNQQPQLCSETYETIYLQGVARFHLIGSSCFSLVFSEKYWGLARCHGLVSASEILATCP